MVGDTSTCSEFPSPVNKSPEDSPALINSLPRLPLTPPGRGTFEGKTWSGTLTSHPCASMNLEIDATHSSEDVVLLPEEDDALVIPIDSSRPILYVGLLARSGLQGNKLREKAVGSTDMLLAPH